MISTGLLLILLTLHGSHCQNNCKHESSNKEEFQYTTLKSGGGFFAMVGDVNDVLQGVITPEINSTVWTHETTGPLGFGAAAVGPLEGLGEAIFVNGIAIVRQTDNKTKNYFETISGREFRTPFSLFLSKDSSPDGNALFFSQNDSTNLSMTGFYEKIYAAVGGIPFCFFGLTEFRQLEAISLSKAPIYREPLFGDLAAGYYTQPTFRLINEYGLTFGCAANFSNIKDLALNDKLRKVLYLNPLDAGSRGQLQVHSHALTLKKCLMSPFEIDASNTRDVYHILSNTTISYINAHVYTLNDIQKIVELSPKNDIQNFVPALIVASLCALCAIISLLQYLKFQL